MIKVALNITRTAVFKSALILVAALFAAAVALDIAYAPTFLDASDTISFQGASFETSAPTSFQFDFNNNSPNQRVRFNQTRLNSSSTELNSLQYASIVLDIQASRNRSYQNCSPNKSPEVEKSNLFA